MAKRAKQSPQQRLVYAARSNSNASSIRRLPSAGAAELRLNTVCPYFAMFPLVFPFSKLSRAKDGDCVLDPFCGRGTTLFAARLRGLTSVGIDSNPVAAAIAAAKLISVTPVSVVDTASRILATSRSPKHLPRGEFWQRCFHADTLVDICKLRESLLRHCAAAEEVALCAIVLGLLHGPMHSAERTAYLSNQMPRTYATKPAAAVKFWKERGPARPPRVQTLDAIARRAQFTLADPPPPTPGKVYCGDARRTATLLSGDVRFNWVVTSPPYFGMGLYRSDQWLRNWFLGAKPSVDYSQQGQLPATAADQFVAELAAVWRSVARRCVPGARLVVRFGYLPSASLDPLGTIRASLNAANCGWQFRRHASAGRAADGKRQANQFGFPTGKAAEEVDVYATLEI